MAHSGQKMMVSYLRFIGARLCCVTKEDKEEAWGKSIFID